MNKKFFVFLLLFLPITILTTGLALVTSAFITDHVREFYEAVIYVVQSLFPTSPDTLLEFELIGMIVGVSILLIMTRLTLFADRQGDVV